ncbi:MAG: membrane protein insertion efficiency factor YidD [Elusimicrobiota bacterium]
MERKQIIKRLINKIVDLVNGLLIIFIKFYQKIISPVLGNNCRFTPTCSNYFIESLKQKGLFKGSVAGFYRIIRCNPFNSGGVDPVVKEK